MAPIGFGADLAPNAAAHRTHPFSVVLDHAYRLYLLTKLVVGEIGSGMGGMRPPQDCNKVNLSLNLTEPRRAARKAAPARRTPIAVAAAPT